MTRVSAKSPPVMNVIVISVMCQCVSLASLSVSLSCHLNHLHVSSVTSVIASMSFFCHQCHCVSHLHRHNSCHWSTVTCVTMSLCLQCDCQVRVTPRLSTSLDEVEKRFEGILAFLTPSLLTRLRIYLSLVRQLPYRIATDLQKVRLSSVPRSRLTDSC